MRLLAKIVLASALATPLPVLLSPSAHADITVNVGVSTGGGDDYHCVIVLLCN
ncbi:hypothetical protein [Nonomuraea sp. B19D2]|uniref:hypothetical protein n=1 Tax=Nonomuraea sp. B19D2 TaxID=3159561 RepID=UPI0032DB8777